MSVTPLKLSEPLTADEAATTLRAALAAIDAGCREVDIGGLQTVDSSAVATLLAIRRYALQRGVDLHITAPPEALASLIGLYEVGELLGVAVR